MFVYGIRIAYGIWWHIKWVWFWKAEYTPRTGKKNSVLTISTLVRLLWLYVLVNLSRNVMFMIVWEQSCYVIECIYKFHKL